MRGKHILGVLAAMAAMVATVSAAASLASITVTSPNGGEGLEIGSVHKVTWTSQGIEGNVTVEYSTNRGATWKTIMPSTDNDGSYDWTVPPDPSDNCLVRITEHDRDEAASDTSDEVFSIVPPSTAYITVVSPNGGENWRAGSTRGIKWTAGGTGEAEYVRIEYSTDRGRTWTTIVPSIRHTASGSYDWMVPNTPSEDCLVRVRGIGGDDAPSDTSDGLFTILPPFSPAIKVTSPNGGETWLVDSKKTITWHTIGIVKKVRIDYSCDGGESWRAIVDAVRNRGSYPWRVPDTPSDNCVVRVSARLPGGQPSDVSDGAFSIAAPPEDLIEVLTPNGGEHLTAGREYEITWESSGIDKVIIEYSKNKGISWEFVAQTAAGDKSYRWKVPEVSSDHCLVRISGNDSDQDPWDMSDAVFSITSLVAASVTVVFLPMVGTPCCP
jgi:hypothetical protein